MSPPPSPGKKNLKKGIIKVQLLECNAQDKALSGFFHLCILV